MREQLTAVAVESVHMVPRSVGPNNQRIQPFKRV
jgi:hypothetical protein